jgi:excinuclease ABC subunit A
VPRYRNILSKSRTQFIFFQFPKGACDHCNGLGTVNEINTKKIIPNLKLSIKLEVSAPLGEYKSSWIFRQLEIIGEKYGFKLTDPIEKILKKPWK